MSKYVYDFAEGNKDMKDLLGGKGANLAEMTNMGLTVPPGFTITAEACLVFLKQDGAPPEMLEEAGEHLGRLQDAMGRDAYRRFIQMFGKIVMDVPGEAFEEALDRAKERKGSDAQDTDLDADDLSALIEEFRGIYREHVGEDFPQDPKEQLRLAIAAVFGSWNGKRAKDYRRQNKISDDLGTAVNVQAMVFGNRGDDSGTGVAFTRDPSTGEKLPYGDYLPNAQGEDVVAGIRNTLPLADLEKLDATSYGGLREAMDTLETHYRDMCDIEFMIEKAKLWILQVRVGKRTAFAEWVMAHDMLDERLIDADTALLRVDANRLEELFKRRVKADGANAVAKG